VSEYIARVILLAGPSGVGKSYIAGRTGYPVLCLDDFYKDADSPSVPRLIRSAAGGPSISSVDWESPAAWSAEDAVDVILTLAREGSADVPVYAIGADRRTGHRTLRLGGARLFVAEGIFAAEIVARCRALGVLADAVALRRPAWLTFSRRLVRDLVERRKPPPVLLRRGVRLWRDERRVLARQAALGCEPANGAEILARVARL
jgi:uridine kinase